jgi:hypothetical protein
MSNLADLYIEYQGRSWAIWVSPHDGGLRAIPQDENEFSEKDLANLGKYLQDEGFFNKEIDK